MAGRARGQARPLSELVLQPPHVRVLRRELHLVALPSRHRLDRLARFLEGLILGTAAQIDNACEGARDLGRGIAAGDVDRDARGIGVAEARVLRR